MQWSNEFDWIVNHGWAFCNILVQSPEKCRKQVRSFIESFELASFIFASHNLWLLSSMTLSFFLSTFVLVSLKLECTISFRCLNAWMLLLWWSSQKTFRKKWHKTTLAWLNVYMGFYRSKDLARTKHIASLLHLLELKRFHIAFSSLRFQSETRFNKTITLPGAFSCTKD